MSVPDRPGALETPGARAPRREAIIDFVALRQNLAVLAAHSAGGPLVVDVTADAYGHGLLRVAAVAADAGVDILSLRDEEDALRVRAAGIDIDVHAWHGPRFTVPPAGSGIAAFGFGQHLTDGAPVGLRPVMTVQAPIAAIKRVGARQGVSYGLSYRTTTETTLALVPLGYADGLPRAASGRAFVSIGGERFPVAGRIAMDQIVVEVGNAAVGLGDTAVIFGQGDRGEPTASDWAGYADSRPGEILARIGGRVSRRYLDGPRVR